MYIVDGRIFCRSPRRKTTEVSRLHRRNQMPQYTSCRKRLFEKRQTNQTRKESFDRFRWRTWPKHNRRKSNIDSKNCLLHPLNLLLHPKQVTIFIGDDSCDLHSLFKSCIDIQSSFGSSGENFCLIQGIINMSTTVVSSSRQ